MSQAYWAPHHLLCATCGYTMLLHGVFQGGTVVVSCSGYQCPEFEVQRKYVATPMDLQEIVAGDMAAPIERESADLEAAAEVLADPPVSDVPTDPVPTDPGGADAVLQP